MAGAEKRTALTCKARAMNRTEPLWQAKEEQRGAAKRNGIASSSNGARRQGEARNCLATAWSQQAKNKKTERKGYNMKTIKVKLTFQESILGTCPTNEDIYRDFIGSNAPDASTLTDEIEAIGVDAVAEKGMTIFPKLPDGTPFLYDYQIKGFFKDACGVLSRLTGKDENGKKKKAVNESSKIKAYKKEIDGLIFPQPRKIPFENYGTIGKCERPLRAQTMQGERVSLACSEEIQSGATVTFSIVMLSDEHEAAVREWLDYGALRGIGQWRNSGRGRFTWEEVK